MRVGCNKHESQVAVICKVATMTAIRKSVAEKCCVRDSVRMLCWPSMIQTGPNHILPRKTSQAAIKENMKENFSDGFGPSLR